jgi:hypothetical protein
MLSTANEFSQECNVIFNPNKCKLMVYERNAVVNESISFNNIQVEPSSYECHLGNLIGPELGDAHIRKCVAELYGRTNVIQSQFRYAHSFTRYRLFKSFCMSVYGCQLWDFSSNMVNQFFTAWRKCIRRIWDLPYRCHSNLLSFICDDLPVDLQLHKRFLKFIWKAYNSENMCSQVCATLAIAGSSSAACRSLNFICLKYGINKYSAMSKSCGKLMSDLRELPDLELEAEAHRIKELIQIREFPHDYDFDFSNDELADLIEFLCTD